MTTDDGAVAEFGMRHQEFGSQVSFRRFDAVELTVSVELAHCGRDRWRLENPVKGSKQVSKAFA